MTVECEQIAYLSEGDVDFVAVDFTPWLDGSEVLNGTPTMADDGATGDLTMDQAAVSSAALTILNRSVAIGKAAQFRIQGQQEGTTYSITITCTTDASRTKKAGLKVVCT